MREEGGRPIARPAPDRPTETEVKERNVSHTPHKPWCPYCTVATSKRDAHARIKKEVPDVEVPIDKVLTRSVDYTYLFDNGSRPTLVMVDHESGRTWLMRSRTNASSAEKGGYNGESYAMSTMRVTKKSNSSLRVTKR